MMPGVGGESFVAEYLDDYFAECDEHLVSMRRLLLALEPFVEHPPADRSLLDELFRNLHTIKGLSAMVGVNEAEQLAHEMESTLRGLRKEELALTAETMDALAGGAKTLEEVIAARRVEQPPPDIESVMNQIATVALAPPPIELDDRQHSQLAAELESGARAWQFDFVPALELAERGITVDGIRTRLGEIGQLIHAAPRVTAEKGIAFVFVVASHADENVFAGWEEDGLTWAPWEAEETKEREGKEEERPAPATRPSSIIPSQVVRVDLARIDELMQMVGALVISRARLEENLKDLYGAVPTAQQRSLEEINQALERQLRDLREGVMRTRMVPIGQVFERMQFVVSDLARESQNKIGLELSGQETEIDKKVVERMMDPLLHLVRNAVSHGLEPADERQAQGKPPQGRLALRASAVGDAVTIEIEDDGRGIDAERAAARACERGMISADTTLDADRLLDVLCAPSFSMRAEADRASGRGVGMEVVRKTVEELGGLLTLNTQVGRGTRFTIRLPVTLAITDSLIVSVGGQTFAAPLPSVYEVIEVQPDSVTVSEEDELLSYRGGVLPILRLAQLFGLTEQFERAFYALVVGSETQPVGLVVDRVLGQREIVVRAVADPLVQVTGIAGATEMGDGRPILILDVAALTRVKPET